MSITARYLEFQITCYATYSTSRPWFLTNCITARNSHKGIQQPRFGRLATTSARPRRGGLQIPNRTVTPVGTTLPCKVWSFTEGFKPGHHIRE
jgi:hypothetical protein